MHPFRQHILKELTLANTKKFSDLKPNGIESNLFVYHLKSLVTEGFIRKAGQAYQLTGLGKRYIDKLSLRNFQPRFQPKIVTVIIGKNSKGDYLLCHSSRQPFYGKYCFPYGKIHFGETLDEAAHRELKEKTGLSATLVHRGDAYLTIYEKEELVAHMLCHVFWGTNFKGNLTPHSSEPSAYSASWKSLNDKEIKIIPGFLKLLEWAKNSKSRFFKELTIK